MQIKEIIRCSFKTIRLAETEDTTFSASKNMNKCTSKGIANQCISCYKCFADC